MSSAQDEIITLTIANTSYTKGEKQCLLGRDLLAHDTSTSPTTPLNTLFLSSLLIPRYLQLQLCFLEGSISTLMFGLTTEHMVRASELWVSYSNPEPRLPAQNDKLSQTAERVHALHLVPSVCESTDTAKLLQILMHFYSSILFFYFYVFNVYF